VKQPIEIHIGDTVYMPEKDPKCSTVYTVERVKESYIQIYHPNTGFLEVQPEALELSLY
jgi:hypothetical protein